MMSYLHTTNNERIANTELNNENEKSNLKHQSLTKTVFFCLEIRVASSSWCRFTYTSLHCRFVFYYFLFMIISRSQFNPLTRALVYVSIAKWDGSRDELNKKTKQKLPKKKPNLTRIRISFVWKTSRFFFSSRVFLGSTYFEILEIL